MIFYNPQLMPNENQIRLFAVSTNQKIHHFNRHTEEIKNHLQDLVEEAYKSNENPLHLLEDYLVVDYNQCCESPDQMTEYIFNHDTMIAAKNILFENWQQYEAAFSNASTSKLVKEDAINIFIETDLRGYLESLTNTFGI